MNPCCMILRHQKYGLRSERFDVSYMWCLCGAYVHIYIRFVIRFDVSIHVIGFIHVVLMSIVE